MLSGRLIGKEALPSRRGLNCPGKKKQFFSELVKSHNATPKILCNQEETSVFPGTSTQFSAM